MIVVFTNLTPVNYFSMAVALKRETAFFKDSYVVKAKMCTKGGRFFNFQKFVNIFQLFVHNFPSKLPPLKHFVALPP